MKANLRTISQLTGFSLATVSNALNNKRGVNRETAEKILQTAREVGYFNSRQTERVKLVVYQATGSVVNDSPFFSQLMAGVESECRRVGFETVTCHLRRDDPEYPLLLDELLHDPASALLVLATEMEQAEAEAFQEAAAPVVILDNWYEKLNLDAVLIDNTDAAFQAVSYLIEMGHTRIGYLQGSFRIKNFYYRRQGYLRAMEEHGLAVDPAFTLTLSTGMESACADMGLLLREHPPLPTAFFADNDMIALGAARALQQAGYRIPGDVSLVGFDDLPFCAIFDPPLTTVKVYNYQMGCAAVRRLMELAEFGEDYCTKTQVTSSFIRRSSVADLRRKSEDI